MKTRTGKWMKEQFNELRRSGGKILEQCYNNPSPAKKATYYDCIRCMLDMSPGVLLWGITRYNTEVYTFAWYDNENFYVRTRDNFYKCPLINLIEEV